MVNRTREFGKGEGRRHRTYWLDVCCQRTRPITAGATNERVEGQDIDSEPELKERV